MSKKEDTPAESSQKSDENVKRAVRAKNTDENVAPTAPEDAAEQAKAANAAAHTGIADPTLDPADRTVSKEDRKKAQEAVDADDRPEQTNDVDDESALPKVNAVAPEELPVREHLEAQGVDADTYTAGVAVTEPKNNLRN